MITRFYGEEEQGRRIARYDYRVPLLVAGYTVQLASGAIQVGMKGSFWVDPDTLDLLRLEVYADDILAGSALEEAASSMTYSRTRIGDARCVAARHRRTEDASEFRGGESEPGGFHALPVVSRGEQHLVRTGYRGHCRRQPSSRLPLPSSTLPAGLTIPVGLTAPITGTQAVGSLIQGRVPGDIKDKNKVLVPAGASVRGRIRRLERYTENGGYFIVGLEFTDVEWAGSRARFIRRVSGHGSCRRRRGVPAQLHFGNPPGDQRHVGNQELQRDPPDGQPAWRRHLLRPGRRTAPAGRLQDDLEDFFPEICHSVNGERTPRIFTLMQ